MSPEEQKLVASIARLAYLALGMAMALVTTEEQKNKIRAVVLKLTAECRQLNVSSLTDAEISLLEKVLAS
jgi:hypothetical protein